MNFDIVIGNPPYNNDVYLDFVELGHNISSIYTLMITPAKWQAKGGKKNEDFRKNIVPYISKIVYYPDCLDIFAIQEDGGIAYYLVEKSKQRECVITNSSVIKPCINSKEARSIIHDESLWNVGNAIVQKIRQSNDYKPYILNEVHNKKKYTININKQLTVSAGTSGCYDWTRGCIKESWIGKGGMLFSSEGVVILPNPKLITDNQNNSSGTSINVFTTDTIEEARSFVSWAYSKFIRLLLLINIGPLNIMNQRGWRFIPDPGPFDHIFTDEELYKKYNLTPEEINIIESVIKTRKK